jgi:hypothetical protein
VHHGRKPDHRSAYAPVCQHDRRVLRGGQGAARDGVLLRAQTTRDAARPEHQRANRGHERLAGALERLADRLDHLQVGPDHAGRVAGIHEIAPVRQADDAIGIGRRLADDVQVVQVARADLSAGSFQLLRRRVGARQGDDPVPGALQFGDDGGADVA